MTKNPTYDCPLKDSRDKEGWQECHIGRGSVIFNDSYGIVWESASMGSSIEYNDRFIWHGLNSKGQQKIFFTKNNSVWKQKGKLIPSPWCNITSIHKQKHLWKVFLGIAPTIEWIGNNSKNGQYLHLNQIHHLQACVRDPYVFVVGKLTITKNALFYKSRALHTYLSENILQNGDFITMTQRWRGMWIPVRLNQIWQSSPESQLLFHMAREILKHSKQFVGLIIAGILGMIGVIAAATIAIMALHDTVQTQQYMHEWHKNASDLWHSQEYIDGELNSRVNNLESAVLHIGDQLYNLNLRGLKCD
nr:endogenous retrovirus group K member 18 Env polyprotein-like [Dasypus novemcinctus]